MSLKEVFTARPYQLEILENIVKENGIVYLPTGGGKTYIAVLAIQRFSKALQKKVEDGGKRIIFMCNTVELVLQQAIELKKRTNLNIGVYVGTRQIDNWSNTDWTLEIAEHQVLVGTAQVFLDAVMKAYIRIKDLSLVIIDECHHATKAHPMHEFMKLYSAEDKQNKPRVVGLSGVLLKGNKMKDALKDIIELEQVMHGNIITVKSYKDYQNVLLYSAVPLEKMVSYNSASTTNQINDEIRNEIECLSNFIDSWDIGEQPIKLSKGLLKEKSPSKKKFCKNLLQDFLFQMDNFGLYGASVAILSTILEFEIKKKTSDTIQLKTLFHILVNKCEYILHFIESKIHAFLKVKNLPATSMHSDEVIMHFASSKLISLLNYVKSTFGNKNFEDISCLLFVQRRFSAKCLSYILRDYVKSRPFLNNVIKTDFMIGNSAIMCGVENTLESKWNKKVMERFRNKEFNVLVCSNVLEEGIDVQTCNYVLVFDPLQTFNSYIQTKGRARSNGSTYVVFCSEDKQTATLKKIAVYREVHEKLKNYLINRTVDFNLNEEFIEKHFNEIIPPLVAPNGAMLLASAAISHVYRYCQSLPSDMFTILVPMFEKLPQTNNGDNIVAITLPTSSTVKEKIYSDPMADVKLAKTSAAIKACKLLLENGELNDKFLPLTKNECVSNISQHFFEHWKKFNDNVNSKLVGKQNKRVYDRISPDELYNAMPTVGEKCYAYEIVIKPDPNDKFDHKNYRVPLLNSRNNYALLLKNRLPRLADMPLFTNQGRLICELSNEPLEFTIGNEKELELLRNFHVTIFRDIIIKKRYWKSFMAMDRRNKENAYLIVPLSEKIINWSLVKKFQRLSSPRPLNIHERKQQVYHPKDFIGSVVSKWYAEDDEQKYLVINVLENMNPLSPFDLKNNSIYNNYVEFYENKYKNRIESIVNKNQFLLEVKPLTSRRNFYISQVGKNYKNKKEQMEVLIPELCHNYKFPNELCLKAVFLPSIIQRLHFMLHAEHIRVRIDNFLLKRTNSVRNLSREYRPKPLIIDYSLRRNVDPDGNAIEMEERFPKQVLTLEAKSSGTLKYNETFHEDQTSWNEYIEPIDKDRSLSDIYPIEISYYSHFIRSDTISSNSVKYWEEMYNKSQLKMPVLKTSDIGPKFQTNPSICDAGIEDKCFISILERSFDNMSDIIVEQYEFVAALTTSGASEIYDMERFELLGDSFLKFSISLFLIKQFPQWHEGFLTAVKSKFVSNRNLVYCMLQTDIPKRINSKLLDLDEWLPPLLSLPENLLEFLHKRINACKGIENSSIYGIELSDEEFDTSICSEYKLDELKKFYCQEEEKLENCLSLDNDINSYVYKDVMRDKVVADTLEALLGVCVKNYGIHKSFNMLEFFGIIKPAPNMHLSDLLELNLVSPLLRTNISSREVDAFLINYQDLEYNLGYKFKDRAFLLQALTHPSYPTNRITGNYQELEFIGDALLDFLVSCYIFERNTNMTPGMLTDLRSALVNNITLGCVCERHRFHLFIKYENQALSEAIVRFANYQESQNHSITNQLRILLEEEDVVDDECTGVTKMNLSEKIEVPKALGDVVEALIAAVYFDSRDLKQTWHVIYRLLQKEINEFANNTPLDPVRELLEKQVNATFSKAITDKNVVMVSCEFTCLRRKVEVCGFASNSQQAKKAAAKHALQYLCKHSN
ncbi:endoribonuclease Dicer [Teleopsis dalmanni]|uniref:endoribonuclease Dicer n=1 Tax=Teleopsis dalmanni TaxID=139649 RepID=UPI0018CCE95F|nr:endoribonuclease Dicer [Teleopsis dalmanni]